MNSIKMALTALVILISVTGCGIRYSVTGKVVDAQSKQPIEGAAVIIHWVGTKFSACLAPYASGQYTMEIAEDITDENGKFTIPKYPLKGHYEMGVYKDGYVCWAADLEFNQQAETGRKCLIKRKFRLGSFMKVRLVPYTDKTYEFEHGSFTNSICRTSECNRAKDRLFYESIRDHLILFNTIDNKRVEEYKKKTKEGEIK